MAVGIVAGRYCPLPVGAWAAAAIVGFLAGLVGIWRGHLRGLGIGGIAVAICCASALAGASAYHYVPVDHIITFSDEGRVLATIRGKVASSPRIHQPTTAFWQAPRTAFLLEAEAIRTRQPQWLTTRGRIRVTVGEPTYDLAAGDHVELVGSLRRIRGPSNPGQYDWRAAGRYQGILVSFSVPGADGVTRTAVARSDPLAELLRRLRLRARRHMGRLGESEEANLLEALVLGERDPALRTLNRAMVEAGVAHLLSISGLHLGIFLGFIYWVARLLAFPPRRAAGAVLVVVIAYVLLAEPRAPLLRGAIMAGAFCVATISGRAISSANALAAAAVLLLAADPLQIFTPSFQLSFCIVAGIAALHGHLKELLFGRWLRRRGLVVFRDRRGGAGLRRWLYYRVSDWLIVLVCLSAAAYLTAAPLVAHHFGLFSPYAPLLSLLLLPVMVAVLVPAYVSLALAWPMPNLSAAIGELAVSAAGAMKGLVMLAQRLPGLSVEVFSVPAWLVAACYVTMGLWAATRRRRRAWPAAATATAALLVGIVATQRPAPAPPGGRVHVLDVGHGSMILLHGSDGRTCLFDAGTLANLDPYHQVLRPFLRAKRLPSPEAVFISHANLDHYNALPALLEREPPARVYLNEFFGRREDDPPGARQLLGALRQRQVEVIRLRRGHAVRVGPEALVEVLWPPPADQAGGLDVNDCSLVLRLSCGGHSVLITGDAGELVEARLAEHPHRIRSDILVLPHHGSVTPTLRPFIEAVGADILLQSSAFRPETPALLEAVAGKKRYTTSRAGWIGVNLSDAGVRVETMRGR